MRFIIAILIGVVLFSCTSEKRGEPCPAVPSVELGIVMPHSDWGFVTGKEYLQVPGIRLDCEDNFIQVVIKNNSDSGIRFYDQKYSWGYYNFKFQIETADSTYIVHREEGRGWWKNLPDYYLVNSGEYLVMDFNIKGCECGRDSTKRPHENRIRGEVSCDWWVGLPNKVYETAKMSVIFDLPKEDADFNIDDSTKAFFPTHLESKPIKIAIRKGFN